MNQNEIKEVREVKEDVENKLADVISESNDQMAVKIAELERALEQLSKKYEVEMPITTVNTKQKRSSGIPFTDELQQDITRMQQAELMVRNLPASNGDHPDKATGIIVCTDGTTKWEYSK